MRYPIVLAALLAAATLPAALAAEPSAGTVLDRIMAADTNHNGVVTRVEFLEWRAVQFARIDRNRDGNLSQADVPTMLRGRADRGRLSDMIAQFDADRDGMVSQREFVDGPTLLFDRADTNRDDRLTEAEIAAARGRARQR